MLLNSSLSPHLAYFVAGSIAVSYVAILYILPAARSKPWEKDPITGQPRDRQHPAVIRARLFAVTFITFFSVFLIGTLIQVYGGNTLSENPIRATLELTGFLPTDSTLTYLRLQIQPLILTAVLFLGPLYTQLLVQSSSHAESFSFRDLFYLQNLRNLIIGPITEEIVFRGCIIATYLLIDPQLRPSATQIIFLSPLWFGAAHVHSIRETYVSNGRSRQALLRGSMISLFQFAYTTVFGWYASFIYLRTGSVVAASLCHSFCNLMGFPPLFGSLKEFPHRRTSIVVSYLLGIGLFSISVRAWITNRDSFPNASLTWWDLK